MRCEAQAISRTFAAMTEINLPDFRNPTLAHHGPGGAATAFIFWPNVAVAAALALHVETKAMSAFFSGPQIPNEDADTAPSSAPSLPPPPDERPPMAGLVFTGIDRCGRATWRHRRPEDE